MTELRKITAIIRTDRLQDVERCLLGLNVQGMTVSFVKGFGEAEFIRFFGHSEEWLTNHVRIEIFLGQDRVDETVDAIAQTADTGRPGDGVIAVLPVERFVHIRRLKN